MLMIQCNISVLVCAVWRGLLGGSE